MGNENLAFKYSNDIYATRKQVSQMLGISNIDKFWNDIISYREEHGSFTSPEDIMKIQGIKEGIYNKIKDKITI